MTSVLRSTLLIGACVALAGYAWALDTKVYSGHFCQPNSSSIYQSPSSKGYMGPTGEVTCPMIRDHTSGDYYPAVVLEGYAKSSSDAAVTCRVWYFDEDDNAFLRGSSSQKTYSGSGGFQMKWEKGQDYSYSTKYLSTGGEGTFALQCTLQSGDAIHQYRVKENAVTASTQ